MQKHLPNKLKNSPWTNYNYKTMMASWCPLQLCSDQRDHVIVIVIDKNNSCWKTQNVLLCNSVTSMWCTYTFEIYESILKYIYTFTYYVVFKAC
jgi:hypothetical protein